MLHHFAMRLHLSVAYCQQLKPNRTGTAEEIKATFSSLSYPLSGAGTSSLTLMPAGCF